jgi:hypothetical protein
VNNGDDITIYTYWEWENLENGGFPPGQDTGEHYFSVAAIYNPGPIPRDDDEGPTTSSYLQKDNGHLGVSFINVAEDAVITISWYVYADNDPASDFADDSQTGYITLT